MFISTTMVNFAKENLTQIQKPKLPAHFWNGLFFGVSIWAILGMAAIFTDCALKLLA